MAEWWRSWHGAPTDPKWRLIAKDAARPVAEVVAVAWALLDSASQHVTRGHADGLDVEVTADFLNTEPEHVEAIIAAMRKRRVIEDGRLRSWEKRQPKREDDTASERKRQQRQRDMEKRQDSAARRDAAGQDDMSRGVTQRHASVTTEQNRTEQRRTDSPLPPDGGAAPDFVDQVIEAAGVDTSRDVRGHWSGSGPRDEIAMWLGYEGGALTEADILAEVRANLPSDGISTLRYFRARMERAAKAKRAGTATRGTPRDRSAWPLSFIDHDAKWSQADSDEHMRLHGYVPTRLAPPDPPEVRAKWMAGKNELMRGAPPDMRKRSGLPEEYRPMTPDDFMPASVH